MPTRPLRTLALAVVATVGLSACTTLGGYGYDDGYGYGSSDYGYDPYYGGGYGNNGYGYDSYAYGAAPYYGWYDNYYYPGVGYSVYDTYGQSYRWNNAQQRYWNGRLRGHRGERRENWQGYRQGRGDRDGDGIRNRRDATPGGPGGRMRRDRDGDGVRDRGPRPNGDRDRDGLRNRYDATPGAGQGRVRRDSDGDGVRNRVDATPRGPGGVIRRDRDGDGVRDSAQRRGRDGRRGRGPRAETITGPSSVVREAVRLNRQQRRAAGAAQTSQSAAPARAERRAERRAARPRGQTRNVEADNVQPE